MISYKPSKSLIFIGVGLGFLVYWGMKDKNHLVSPQVSESHSMKIKLMTSPQGQKDPLKKVIKKEESSKTKLSDEKKISERSSLRTHLEEDFSYKTHIRFQIVEGLALAGGDILLGQPTPEIQSQGYIEYNEKIKLWPNGEIPFGFDKNVTEEIKKLVYEAIDEFHERTSIRFVGYEDHQEDLIVFSFKEGLCASYIGRVGGAQPVFVSSKCQGRQIRHEIMHVLGFIHEHQRDFREQHIEISRTNVQKDKVINFDILPQSFQQIYRGFHSYFDAESITLYDSYAFSKRENLKTMKLKSGDLISRNQELSEADLAKIRDVYERRLSNLW